MIKLLVQDIRVKGHVDDSVKTIGDTDTMGSELWAVDVCNVDIGEQVLGGWFLLKKSEMYISSADIARTFLTHYKNKYQFNIECQSSVLAFFSNTVIGCLVL